jgi:hypothetical protein
MSDNKKKEAHILDLLEKNGKRFYHILDYDHNEINALLAKIENGYLLTEEERQWLTDKDILDFSTFSGSYEDLVDKPFIPTSIDELDGYEKIENLETELQLLTADCNEELASIHEELDAKYDANRIKKDPKGGINFFFGTLLDEVINIGRPIDYSKLTDEDYKDLSVNINCIESKAPEYDDSLKSVFCNGTLTIIEEVPGQDFITISWTDKEKHTIQVPADVNVYAGGNGLDSPADYPATGLIILSGSLKNVYGGSLGEGKIGFTNIMINGGSVLTAIGGGQSIYKVKSYKNHVGKNHFVVNKGTVETMFLGSQGNGVVNQTVLHMNGGTINDLTAGGESGTTLLTEVNLNDGSIKQVQGVNRGHVGCITYNLVGGDIETFYAGGEPNVGSVDGKYDHCRLFIDGTTFRFNPEPGTNNRIKDHNAYVSGSILKKYKDDLKINSNNIQKLNLVIKDYIEGDSISKIEEDYNALIAELEKEESNKFRLVKEGHMHTSEDIADLITTIQDIIQSNIEDIDIGKYATKEDVKVSFDSVNATIDSILIDINQLKGEDARINNTLTNITNKISQIESNINTLETSVNYRTTNEDINEIISNLGDNK